MLEQALPNEKYVRRALAEWLRAEAAIQGLSAAAVSAQTGLKAQTVRRIFKGERDVGLVEFMRICSVFEADYAAASEKALVRARDDELRDVQRARRIDENLREGF